MFQYTDLFNLPGARRFLSLMTDALVSRRSVITVLPDGIQLEPLWSKVRSEFWQLDLSYREIDLSQFSPQDLPVIVLRSVFNAELKDSIAITDPYAFIDKLIEEGCLPDIIYINGLDSLEDIPQRNWLKFFEVWAGRSHRLVNVGIRSPALFTIVNGRMCVDKLPVSDLYLSTFWWWGFPSILETYLLCRIGEAEMAWTPENRWRERLLPMLACGDINLINYLWDAIYLPVPELIEKIRNYSSTMDWNEKYEQIWINNANLYSHLGQIQPGEAPPKPLQSLWARGWITRTQEYGIELHSVLLAKLRRDDEIRHRIWRGQADILLPVIDNARLEVCKYLTKAKGPQWPLKWHQPKSEEECEAVKITPMAAQLGYLEWLLRCSQHFVNERKWWPLISSAHQIRNEIAHYRPVNLLDFQRFFDEVQQMHLLF